MSSLTGYKSFNNQNLTGSNTTTQDITEIENDIEQINIKLSLFKSVKDFGALGDGITDDSVAIQNCLNTYGRIWFPEGIYLTSKSLIVYPNTHIYGDGRGKSILKAVTIGSNTGNNLFNCHMENISIRSMTIDGNRDNISGAGGHCIRGNLSTSGAYNSLFEDLELKNSDGYGMGFQVNTIKNVIINNCFLENLGNDGIDFKNRDDSNEAVIFSNVIVKDPCMKTTNTNKAGIDLRGHILLNNIAVIFENTTQPCDGIRLRNGQLGDSNGIGGRRSSLSNFYVKAYEGYNTRFGVNILNENVNVCNGTISNFGTAIKIHLEGNYCKVSNVFATNCDIGFQDSGIENSFIHCEARNCSSYGFYLSQCTKSNVISCISNDNDYGFYDDISVLSSLSNCHANNNVTANYNGFTASEIFSCLDGASYKSNVINGSIITNGFQNVHNSFSLFTKDITVSNSNIGMSGGNINTNGNINITGSGVYSGDGSGITNIQPSNIVDYIDATQIGTGIITNSEFNYLNNVSSNIQDQFTDCAKLSIPNLFTASNVMTGVLRLSLGANLFIDSGKLDCKLIECTSINNTGNLITNGIENSDWLYGREDGEDFYDPKTAFSLSTSPIGSIIEWNSTDTTIVDATSTIISGAPTLDKGVWLCNGSVVVTKGSGSYITDNFIYLSYDTAVNGTAYNLNQGMRYHIHTGSNTQNCVYPSITLNATSSGAYIRPKYFIDVSSVGTMTISAKFVFTKIA